MAAQPLLHYNYKQVNHCYSAMEMPAFREMRTFLLVAGFPLDKGVTSA